MTICLILLSPDQIPLAHSDIRVNRKGELVRKAPVETGNRMVGIAYLLETSLSFRPGYAHTITVTLNTSPDQEQIEISIDPGINDWN